MTKGQSNDTFDYDAENTLVQYQGGATQSGGADYSYDGDGRRVKKAQPLGTLIFVYNIAGQLVAEYTSSTPEQNGTSYLTSDTLGSPRVITKADVSVTQRSYTGGTAVATPTVNYSYDASGVTNSKGRLTSVSSAVSAYNYTAYDALGRITGSQQVTDGQTYSMSYQYDLAGNMTSQTYPTGRVVTQSFDNAGRLASINGQASGQTPKTYANSFGYSPHGAIEYMRLGNGRFEHTSFNNRLQPTEIALGNSAVDSSVLKLNYEYGTTANNGNVLKQVITVPTIGTATGFTATQHFQYDQLNRLTGAQEVNGISSSWQTSGTLWQQKFSFDRYGNRAVDTANTTASMIGPNPQVSTSTNRIVPRTSPVEYYHHDLAGNLDIGQSGETMAYDAENKMVQYQGGASQSGGADYSYDGDGRRVKKATPAETLVFVYNISAQLVAEYSTATPEQNGTSYLTSDHLGSPRVIAKADGSVRARHDYLPFGEELFATVGSRATTQGYDLGSSPTDKMRQKFTQKERDTETGLDYFGARYHASAQGRFTSVDPLYVTIQRLVDPQRLNLYAFTRNNPLKYTDPNGMDLRISAKTEEEARKKYALLQKGLTAEDRKHTQFVVGDGKNGFAKGTFGVTADKDHKSESDNFKTVQKIANAKDVAVLNVVGPKEQITVLQASTNQDGSWSLRRVEGVTFSFTNPDSFAGHVFFPHLTKLDPALNYIAFSTNRNTEAYAASDSTDEEIVATIHHELRHIVLGDFGRTIPKCRRSPKIVEI